MTRLCRAGWLTLLLVVAAGCGSEGDDDAADGDADSDGDCSPDGVRFRMTGAFELSASTGDPVTVGDLLGDDPSGPIVGVWGELEAGWAFGLYRDGDVRDGDVESVGEYDVSQYPYNMHYQHGPRGSAEVCAECDGFFAMAGTYAVMETSPTYRATFSLSSLREGAGEDPGGAIDGTVDGCLAVPNP